MQLPSFMLVNKCHLKYNIKKRQHLFKVAEYESKITFKEIKKWIEDNCILITEKVVENYLNKTALGLMLGDEENEK